MGRIASEMGVVPGTVTTMIKSLSRDGLVRYEPRIGVTLTQDGRKLALEVLRRHRLLELFLVKILGFDWSEIHEEAEKLEHSLSERLLERIDEILGKPTFDPHGDPIPTSKGTIREQNLRNLSEFRTRQRVRVRRILDQDSTFLRLINRYGLHPGTEVRIIENQPVAGVIQLQIDHGNSVVLSIEAASKILVQESSQQ